MHSASIHISTPGRGLVDITHQIAQTVAEGAVRDGVCNVFVHHTSASLIIQENADPDVRRDLDAFFARLVPDGDRIFVHTAEGPDDMPAHVRATLTATTLTVPVAGGRLDLGTWQGIYLWEHRHRPHSRRVTITVLGA
jgi:secondary thiamine-phosphate synthase enzyme